MNRPRTPSCRPGGGAYPQGVLPAPALDVLCVRSVRVEAPGALLDLLPEQGALAWVHGGEGLVGWGEAARVELTGDDRSPTRSAGGTP